MGVSGASIATGVALLLASFAIIAIARKAAYGKLRRNHWAGIRTPTSLASDEAWDGIHRLAAPGLIRVGRATFLIAIFAFFVDPNEESILSFVVIGLTLAIAVGVIGVSIRAHRRWTADTS